MATGEKRTHRRAAVVLRIKLRYEEVDAFISKFATNVSRAGLFIRSKKPKEPGTAVRFELRLADGSNVVQGEGEVRWTRAFDPDAPREPHGMGIAFTRLDDDSRAMIERVVTHREELGHELPPGRIPFQLETESIPVLPIEVANSERTAAPSEPLFRTPEEATDVGPMHIARDGSAPPAAAPRSLTPELKKRARPSLAEVMARAETEIDPPPDVDALFGSRVSVASALARARQLTDFDSSDDDDSDLDELTAQTATAPATAQEASEKLAALFGDRPLVRRRQREKREPLESADLAEGTDQALGGDTIPTPVTMEIEPDTIAQTAAIEPLLIDSIEDEIEATARGERRDTILTAELQAASPTRRWEVRAPETIADAPLDDPKTMQLPDDLVRPAPATLPGPERDDEPLEPLVEALTNSVLEADIMLDADLPSADEVPVSLEQSLDLELDEESFADTDVGAETVHNAALAATLAALESDDMDAASELAKSKSERRTIERPDLARALADAVGDREVAPAPMPGLTSARSTLDYESDDEIDAALDALMPADLLGHDARGRSSEISTVSSINLDVGDRVGFLQIDDQEPREGDSLDQELPDDEELDLFPPLSDDDSVPHISKHDYVIAFDREPGAIETRSVEELAQAAIDAVVAESDDLEAHRPGSRGDELEMVDLDEHIRLAEDEGEGEPTFISDMPSAALASDLVHDTDNVLGGGRPLDELLDPEEPFMDAAAGPVHGVADFVAEVAAARPSSAEHELEDSPISSLDATLALLAGEEPTVEPPLAEQPKRRTSPEPQILGREGAGAAPLAEDDIDIDISMDEFDASPPVVAGVPIPDEVAETDGDPDDGDDGDGPKKRGLFKRLFRK